MRSNEGTVEGGVQLAASHVSNPHEAASLGDGFDPSDWKSRIIAGRATGAAANPPAWLDASYETLCTHVMDPAYPCFFGTIAEKRGEMFYSYVNGKDIRDLPATMQTFAELVTLPQYRKNNIAIFFEPDAQPLTHEAYHAWFWSILQHLHDVDPDPKADAQPEPSHEDWEFSFAGVETFVVCACPSFRLRHSRNLGPGMVLLFQPRSVFVDTITNKVIGREARNQVRKRLETWDEISAHPDLGFYGDPGNLEWKQYFLDDANLPADDRCPFLKRQREKAAQVAAAVPAHASTHPDASIDKVSGFAHGSYTHWHPRAAAAAESPFAPHAARHGAEHRHLADSEHERREHGEE
jgi:FPC/CPF motif-containing protein YcgG